jgi:hypothetical protein
MRRSTATEDKTRENVLSCELVLPDILHIGFIYDPKDWYEILILWLRDKLCDDPDVVRGTLGVRNTHYAQEEVNLALQTRVQKTL